MNQYSQLVSNGNRYLRRLSHSTLSFSFIIALTLVTSACGMFSGKEKDYLYAKTIDTIDVPEDMKSKSLEPLYVVPEIQAKDEFGDAFSLEEFDVPRPRAINVDKSDAGVKMQKLAGLRWISIEASTGQVWPRTQNFLSQYGIPVVQSNPILGIIDTAEIAINDQPKASRYRIFLEKGLHPDTTEIRIVQMNEGSDGPWPKMSEDQAKEDFLVDELAAVLAESVSNNSASLLGQNIGGNVKVGLGLIDGEPTMRLNLSMKRSYATISYSLKQDGLVLWDKSSDHRLFYFARPEDIEANEGGWFSGKDENEAPYKLDELLKHLGPSPEARSALGGKAGAAYGDPLEGSIGIIGVLIQNGKSVDFVLRTPQGDYLDKSQAKALLRTIRKNLI